MNHAFSRECALLLFNISATLSDYYLFDFLRLACAKPSNPNRRENVLNPMSHKTNSERHGLNRN